MNKQTKSLREVAQVKLSLEFGCKNKNCSPAPTQYCKGRENKILNKQTNKKQKQKKKLPFRAPKYTQYAC